MVFHGSLSDSKCLQVSRTLLSILAVLSNAVIWIVYTRPPASKPSRPFNNPFVIVPKAPNYYYHYYYYYPWELFIPALTDDSLVGMAFSSAEGKIHKRSVMGMTLNHVSW